MKRTREDRETTPALPWQRGRRWLRRLCLVSGSSLLLFVGAARLHSALASRAGLEQFAEARAGSAAALGESAAPDLTLWSPKRTAAWQASRTVELGAPIAVVRIPRLALEVPVWEGIDEITLNRGLGHVPGTAVPGTDGNVAIAGHRDGFFRVLKDIVAGDRIELETLDGVRSYEVENTRIVVPKEVSVLEPTAAPVLTLVTCYPFYFVGDAPERFIVRAGVRSATEERGELPRTDGSRSTVPDSSGSPPKTARKRELK